MCEQACTHGQGAKAWGLLSYSELRSVHSGPAAGGDWWQVGIATGHGVVHAFVLAGARMPNAFCAGRQQTGCTR